MIIPKTEKEASETVCPKLSRFVSSGVEGFVDFYETDCLGSRCAWWVWDAYKYDKETGEYTLTDCGHCGAMR